MSIGKVLGFSLAALVALGSQNAFAAGNTKRGEALAKANCSACHAIGRRGDEPQSEIAAVPHPGGVLPHRIPAGSAGRRHQRRP